MMIPEKSLNHLDEFGKLYENLLPCQRHLIKEADKLYGINEHARSFYGDILGSHLGLPIDQLAMQVALFAFNSNILTRKTNNLISHTVYYNDNGVHFYCYKLSYSLWHFAIHATIYNIPLVLLDVRRDYNEFTETIAGYNVSLSSIALRLRLLVFGNLLERKSEPLTRYQQYHYRAELLFGKVEYKLGRYIRLMLCGGVPSVSSTQNYENSFEFMDSSVLPNPLRTTPDQARLLLLTENIANMGHYFWNDALGIITYSLYLMIPRDACLLRGEHGYSGKLQLSNMIQNSVIAPPICLSHGFHVDFPVLALRTLPVHELASKILSDKLLSDENPFEDERDDPKVIVSKPSLTRDNAGINQDPSPVILFTLRLGNRPWANSKEAILLLAHYFSKRKKCIFVIDGMTMHESMSYHDLQVLVAEVLLSQEIVASLSAQNFDAVTITGKTFKQKLITYSNTSIFVQPLGSGNNVPYWILRKPLICFGSSKMIELGEKINEAYLTNAPPQIVVCTEKTEEDVDEGCLVDCKSIIEAIDGNADFKNILY